MPTNWRHIPWLAAIAAAPLWFGSVNPGGQALVGLLFGMALWTTATERGPIVANPASLPPPPAWAWPALLLLPLIPLPADWVGLLSPEARALARDFGDPTNRWLTLSVSPGDTVNRIWEWLLATAAFVLARHGVSRERLALQFAGLITGTLALLTLAELYNQVSGQEALVGLWKVSWGNQGAGTFANRNHFAAWMTAGLLMSAALWLRSSFPLRGLRGHHPVPQSRLPAQAVLLAGITLAAAAVTLGSGSRGGMLALMVGTLLTLILLGRTTSRGRRWQGILRWGFIFMGLVIAVGAPVLERWLHLPEQWQSGYPKPQIWAETLRLIPDYLATGSGWGTFASLYNLRKATGGGATFWHAENDYLQWILEAGLPGLVLAVWAAWAFVARGVRPVFRRGFVFREPEILLGTFAALGALLFFAGFEFLAQIPGVLILGAALAGGGLGLAEQTGSPVVHQPPGRRLLLRHQMVAILYLALATSQAVALFQWNQVTEAGPNMADRIEAAEQSLDRWPWSARRVVVRTRLEGARLHEMPREERETKLRALRLELDAAQKWFPLDWELRQERAWLEVSHGADPARAWRLVQETLALNPLQPQLPLDFARLYRTRDPQRALELLRDPRLNAPRWLPDVLKIAWAVERSPSKLWTWVPDTTAGYQALARFARIEGLLNLATQALWQGRSQSNLLETALKLLELRRLDLVGLIESQMPDGPEKTYLTARLAWEEGRTEAAWSLAHTWLVDNQVRLRFPHQTGGPEVLEKWRSAWVTAPDNLPAARQFAALQQNRTPESRDLADLQQLARQFPNVPEFTGLLMQTWQSLGATRPAAEIALQLMLRRIRDPR